MEKDDLNSTRGCFQTTVRKYVDYNEFGTRDLAVEFEVAESTVSRWIRGVARPHPRKQAQIIRFIFEN